MSYVDVDSRLVLSVVIALAALPSPAALPLLTPAAFSSSPYAAPGEDLLETIGWPQFADAVSQAVATIPASDRAGAVIYAGNYGEAGALERYGPARHVPPVYSGHNAFGSWGPPPEGSSPVVVITERFVPGRRSEFTGCRLAVRFDNGLNVKNEEQGDSIWVCDGPVSGWKAAWPDLVHLMG